MRYLAGFQPEGTASHDIVFTADLLDEPTLDMLAQLGARSPGHEVWLQVNPGFGHGHSQKPIPAAKIANTGFGMNICRRPRRLSLATACRLSAYICTLVRVWITHISHRSATDAMVQQVIANELDLAAISAGGGLSVPYRSGEETIDTDHYFDLWDVARRRIIAHLGHSVALEIEPGRFLVAEAGVLVAQVRTVKAMGSRHFVLVDAEFNDLMRPAMYGSYHTISLLPADGRDRGAQPLHNTVVGGPAVQVQRCLYPNRWRWRRVVCRRPQVGDYLVFHDTGVYGASMSSNYNSRPLLPEVLFERGQARRICRRQPLQALFDLEISSS